jgi:hypothetical protein
VAGGWWLMLNWCERKALLAGWQPASRKGHICLALVDDALNSFIVSNIGLKPPKSEGRFHSNIIRYSDFFKYT